MAGTDLTILVALRGGRHQLPVAVRPAARPRLPRPADARSPWPRRPRAPRRRAGRRCATRSPTSPGFGAVFTLLGVTATFAAGPLVDYLPALRIVGGADPDRPGAQPGRASSGSRALERNWRPLDAGAAGSLATATGHDRASARGRGRRHGVGDRLGGRIVSARGGWLASFGLGAIFAIGWTPCIGIILGGILTWPPRPTTVAQGALLLVAYTLGPRPAVPR